MRLVSRGLARDTCAVAFSTVNNIRGPTRVVTINASKTQFRNSGVNCASEKMIIGLDKISFGSKVFGHVLIGRSSSRTGVGGDSFSFCLSLPFDGRRFTSLSVLRKRSILTDIITRNAGG